jgi:hypothetical protein
MADEKLTQQPIATSAADNDLFYIVRVSDGLSMQITKDNFLSNFLKNNQTITLSGDATGSGTTSINVTVVDNSHNHTIANVTGLQAQLNLKANLTAITKALIDALGVNATTLDGIDSTQFLRSDVDDTMNGTLRVNGQVTINNTSPLRLIGSGAGISNQSFLTFFENDNTTRAAFFGFGSSNDNDFTIYSDKSLSGLRLKGAGGINDLKYFQSGIERTIWHANNDGAGSGLDADLLDGLQGSQFLRNDVNGTLTGNLTATGTIQAPLFLEVSDERLKTKIVPISKSIRTFELKEFEGKKRYGVIAQELEKTNPELVHTSEEGFKSLNEEGFKSVNYTDFICMKLAEQENEIEQLKILVKQLIDKG